MRVLLLSTYELGHQPLGIAVPAAALAVAGHEVSVADLSLEEWPAEAVLAAEAAIVSVPMHTATQLALPVIRRLRQERPGIRLALHGLYAPVLAGHEAIEADDLLVAGDPIEALLAWLDGSHPGGLVTDLGPARPARPEPVVSAASATTVSVPVPLRRGLPPLEAYAGLLVGGRKVVTGSTAASHGCNHTCRHCPVAVVYGGRSRVVPVDAVLADVAQLVAAGAGHVSFADPDFLNRPRHAAEVARRLHEAFPGVSFDATVKVEHICRHEELFPELAAAGLVFVVSAFESVDDAVLAQLDKGHTAAEGSRALQIARSAGVEVRPSWMPFTPWTTVQSIGDLLAFVARHDLVWSTDPVQYSIRLLLPTGSLLLADPDPVLAASLRAHDPETGSVAWASPDPTADGLQQAIAALVEAAAAVASPIEETFASLWDLVGSAGADLPAVVPEPASLHRFAVPGPDRAHLSESWFCCAEPTAAQLHLVSSAASLLETPA
jgi:hypothetical protein